MVILQINNIDFSSYVNQRSYGVQSLKEYAQWVDGNRITHRTFAREKVTGSFNMTFLTATALDGFIAALDAVTVADDYAEITLYVENEHRLMTINAFVTYSIKTLWTQDTNQTPAVFGLTVNVQQR